MSERFERLLSIAAEGVATLLKDLGYDEGFLRRALPATMRADREAMPPAPSLPAPSLADRLLVGYLVDWKLDHQDAGGVHPDAFHLLPLVRLAERVAGGADEFDALRIHLASGQDTSVARYFHTL